MRHFFITIRPLLEDFLSTIAFVIFYAITGKLVWGIALGIAIGIGQIAFVMWRGIRPDLMQWASLALVIVLGGASLLTSDPRFVMLKPSIGAFAIAIVMLRKGWMVRYVPQPVTEYLGPGVLIFWGYVWSAMIFALGFANLYVAFYLGTKTWLWFTSTVPITAQLGLFAIQYVTIRWRMHRAIRARNMAQGATAA